VSPVAGDAARLGFIEHVVGQLVAEKQADPAPAAEADSDTANVVWHHGENAYSADGATPELVSDAEHAVLKAFMEQRRPMSGKDITKVSGWDNASQLVGQIKKLFPGKVWTPGKRKKGRGYRIDVRPLPR
jgi:hypothetical protein